MKVALVHDDLVQWGGAERVFLAISEIFPDAPIYTSVFDSSHPILAKKFAGKKIITSYIQNLPGWKGMYKALLPLYPLVFEQFDFSNFDLVISHTTRFAKSVITKPKTTHICYCHTPPRFLWDFSGEKTNAILKPYLSFLRVYDQVSAKRVEYFIAGSKNAALRIKKVYGKDSVVVPPFVDDFFFREDLSFKSNYFLVISRLSSYKKIDLVVKEFNHISQQLRIVGVGPELKSLQKLAKGNIKFYKSVDELVLRLLIAGCSALIITAEEDFGLTSLEAQAMGKPVIAYEKGGVSESVIENETGLFFESQTEESLHLALERFEKIRFNKEKMIENARRFRKESFRSKFLEAINRLS